MMHHFKLGFYWKFIQIFHNLYSNGMNCWPIVEVENEFMALLLTRNCLRKTTSEMIRR